MGNNDLRWAHALIKEQDAQIKEQKARSDVLEKKLTWYKQERVRLQNIEQSTNRVFSEGVNETRKRAEKAEAKLEHTAKELERISDNYYKFCPLKTEPLQNIFEDLKKLEKELKECGFSPDSCTTFAKGRTEAEK